MCAALRPPWRVTQFLFVVLTVMHVCVYMIYHVEIQFPSLNAKRRQCFGANCKSCTGWLLKKRNQCSRDCNRMRNMLFLCKIQAPRLWVCTTCEDHTRLPCSIATAYLVYRGNHTQAIRNVSFTRQRLAVQSLRSVATFRLKRGGRCRTEARIPSPGWTTATA